MVGIKKEAVILVVSLLVVVLLCDGVFLGAMASGFKFTEEDETWRKEKGRWEESEREFDFKRKDWVLLDDMRQVVKTEAGEMKIVRNPFSRIIDRPNSQSRPMHIGFITMEPKTLFLPQYLDSTLILFIRKGEAKVGLIYKDDLAERRMITGDVYRIPAGSAFYLVNTGEGQRLEIICSIDTTESVGFSNFQSFFIAGGTYPASILSGFDHDTLATAFNISYSELGAILTRQRKGPIIYVTDAEAPNVWNKLLQVKYGGKKMNNNADIHEEDGEGEKNKTWSWRKLLVNLFGSNSNEDNKKTRTGKSPDSYNLFDKRPDFSNDYGWSVALDESEYTPLGHSGIGVYLVNLTAGSMMAPHLNPRATEYGIILSGSGRIQVVFPNGTFAVDVEVSEGDVFWIPRYFPFCQIASRKGPFEFFGFTTSARRNQPQFLAGASSILRTLRSPELATAFGVTDDILDNLLDSQREAIILPSAEIAPPHKEEEKERRREEERRESEREGRRETRVEEMIKSLEKNVAMGFD